jgi:Family of unknown function (DUF6353)
MKIPTALTAKFGRQLLQLKTSSPQIMFVGGAVAGIGGVVLACKSTLKLSDTLEGFEELKEKSQYALENKVTDNEGHLYDEKAFAKDQAVIRVKTILAVSKLYAPAAGLLILSATLMTGSHVTLTRRNAATAAAYASVDKAFTEYRERVRTQLGNEVDDEMRHGSRQVSETIQDEDGKKKVVKHTRVGDGVPSMYAKFFDESSVNWVRDPEYNRIFLQSQQAYWNQRLQSVGHVFLNEVYDALGLERTRAGQVVGWFLGPDGDNFVDFGIFDNVANERVRDFVNGHEYSILLDFNVDGLIHHKLKKD